MFIQWLKDVSIHDKSLVGGKNASLGEMYNNLSNKGIKIPNGFAVTTKAFSEFINHNNLKERIQEKLDTIEYSDLVSLRRTGLEIRMMIQNGDFTNELENKIVNTYSELSSQYNDINGDPQQSTDVAVRSSSTAEDLQDASFAGQQETYLNVRGKSQVLGKSLKTNKFKKIYYFF